MLIVYHHECINKIVYNLGLGKSDVAPTLNRGSTVVLYCMYFTLCCKEQKWRWSSLENLFQ